ncbi:hypothetical protein MVEN_01335000 [Mycena venus]|uniref:Phytocyanin domain-containing protein n=1 Tax=Mycena venus TaxID=2733690 RepID=A0A8H7CW30_9AGAR|nr:hypothetical protein MVEN_01335000 [Mycena venus]
MLSKLTFATLALAGAASAAVSNGGLKILAPGGDGLWWIAAQQNNVVWTCGESTFPQFTILINNSDTSLLTAITPLIAVEQNYNCNQGIASNLITQPVGTGYTIVLADILNSTNIYAVSDPFEIKALSAGYPPTSNTPVDQASATVSKGTSSNVVGQTGSPTGAGSGSPPAKTGGAPSLRSSSITAGALVGVAAAVAALL